MKTDKPVGSQFPSIKLDQLVYVELEASNGGMMLMVSEEGFSFRAVTPVRPNGRIPFSFTINGTEKLQGYGKIEWTQDDGKVAGLQFMDVTTEFLNALRKWLTQLSAPAVPSFSESSENSNFVQPHRESFSLPALQAVTVGVNTNHTNEPALNFGRPLGVPELHVDSSPAQNLSREMPANELPRSTFLISDWDQPNRSPEPAKSRPRFVAVAFVAVCFLTLIVVLYTYREAVGQSLISLGQKMSSTSESSQAQQPKTSEAPKPAIETQQTPGQETRTKPEEHVSPQPGLVTDSRYQTGNASSPLKADSSFRDEKPVSTGVDGSVTDSRSHDPAEQVRSLWSAVSQGNTSAEVALAKLYLIGGGVTKNCDQARVLLQAAAKKGNGEAIDKLSQISQQGCP
jgi:hypothetical protein